MDKQIECETCHETRTFVCHSQADSEIELVGFIALSDSALVKDQSVAPKWICQNCFTAFLAINEAVTPVFFEPAERYETKQNGGAQ